MDFQFWMWVAIVIITLIARAKKKRKNLPETDRSEPEPSPIPAGEVRTFEELLNEIQGSKGSSEPQVATVEKEDDFIDTKEDIWHNKENEEDVEVEEKPLYEELSQTILKRDIEKKINPLKSSLWVDYTEKDEQIEKTAVSVDFLKSLKSRDGLKKAFILSEILHRKY